MKAYKIEILVVDFEEHGEDVLIHDIENMKYYSPNVMDIREADIGEWSDDHPLNKRDTCVEEYKRIFPNE